jgi:hypothetical protein
MQEGNFMIQRVLLGVLVFVLAVSVSGFAGTTCPTATVIPTDGRIVDFDFVANGTTNFYQFKVTSGRSYSVEVRENYDDPPSTLAVSLFSDSGCLTSLAGTTDTAAAEPALPANAFRRSFTAANSNVHTISVQNTGSAGRYMSVSVSETSLYCPNWSSQAPFFSAFAFANTTSQPISGTLRLFNTSGSLAGSTPVTLAVSGAALCYTSVGASQSCNNLNPTTGQTGFAVFTHNGPPGAVQAQAFTQNFSFPTPFTQVIEFKPIRQGK